MIVEKDDGAFNLNLVFSELAPLHHGDWLHWMQEQTRWRLVHEPIGHRLWVVLLELIFNLALRGKFKWHLQALLPVPIIRSGREAAKRV